MAIFPNLELEKMVQTGDKTRLDASKSFISKGEEAVTLVEIEPETGAGFITVTASNPKDWFLDWQYSGISRTETVTVRITTDDLPVTASRSLIIMTSADDGLFSSDSDLIMLEGDILKYVRPGRNSFLDFHRKAQETIVDWFNAKNYRRTDGTKIEKGDFLDVGEVTEWSKYLTLAYIFQDASNAVGDIFDVKSKQYESRSVSARERGIIRLDLNQDNVVGNFEGVNVRTLRLDRQ